MNPEYKILDAYDSPDILEMNVAKLAAIGWRIIKAYGTYSRSSGHRDVVWMEKSPPPPLPDIAPWPL